MTRETLVGCPQCGQARPLHGPCPWHEGPGVVVTAPMQMDGLPVAGPRTVTLAPAPHSLGGQGQADYLFRELGEARAELRAVRRALGSPLGSLVQAAEYQQQVSLTAVRRAERAEAALADAQRRAQAAEREWDDIAREREGLREALAAARQEAAETRAALIAECEAGLVVSRQRDEYLAQRDEARQQVDQVRLLLSGEQEAHERTARERDQARVLLSRTHARCHFCGASVPRGDVPRHAATCPQHPLGRTLVALRELVCATDEVEAATDCVPCVPGRLRLAEVRYDQARLAARVLLGLPPPATCHGCGSTEATGE